MNKFSRRLVSSLAILLGCLHTSVAADTKQAWDTPVQIDLPAPERTIVLRRDVDIQNWLANSGLGDKALQSLKTTRLGPQTLVQTQVPDEAWENVKTQACSGSAVVSCGTATCQAIQLQSEVTNTQTTDKLKVRIVPKQRSLNIPEPETEANMCKAPVPADLAETPKAGTDLVLEIPNLNRETTGSEPFGSEPFGSEPSGSEPSGSEPFGSELVEVEQEAVIEGVGAKAIQLAVNHFSAQPSFASSNLPADTSDYDLLVGEGCREVRIPLDSVEPAYVPGRFVAVVSQADVDAVALTYGLTVLESTELQSTGEQLVVFAPGDDVISVLAMLALDTRVSSSQKEFVYTTAAQMVNYSDTYAPISYGPEATGAVGLHAETQGANQIVVVIDTGVAVEHPDLVGRVETADFTGQGFAADAHGTAVAGIIAATANNAVGTYGVAPAAKIHALKACQPINEGGLEAKCWSSTLVKSLDAAIQAGATVINMSLAGPPDPMVAKYVAEAVAKGALVVAGAGNGGPSAKQAYPAALPGVIAVTAVDKLNRVYAQANQGGYIDVAAPGVAIVTTAPGDAYPVSSGTSWAAAHVSGVAALLKDLVPFLSASEIAGVLSSSATDLGEAGVDDSYGSGLINACQAASAATADAIGCGDSDEI